MKKLDSKGFGVVEGLLIVVIIGLIGGVGYYVYSQNKDSSNDATSEATKPAQNEPEMVEGTENWKTETNEEFGFSYKYPADDDCKIFTTAYEKDSSEYKDGARINTSVGCYFDELRRNTADPFEVSVAAIIDPGIDADRYGEDLMMGNALYKLKSNERIEKDGHKGVKWVYAPADQNASDEIIYYQFIVGDYDYFFTINGTGDKLEGVKGTELGEKIFATLQFTN